jgi:hypothetical protein
VADLPAHLNAYDLGTGAEKATYALPGDDGFCNDLTLVWFTASKTDADFAMFAVDSSGPERLVDRVAGRVLLHDVERGGRALVVLIGNEASRLARLWIYEIGASAPEPITREGIAPMVVVSPDGARFAGVDAEGALRIFSARGQEVEVVPGRFPGKRAIGWEKGGNAVFLRTEAFPVLVSKVELSSGAAAPHLTLPARSGSAGLVAVLTLSLAENGDSYAYSYYEVLSRLYLIEGLPARP